MDDVTDQPSVVTPVETTTPPVASGENKPDVVDAPQGIEAPTVNPELENLKKALKQEREQIKALRREQASAQGRKALEDLPQDNLEQVMGHPFVQDLQLKVAEFELKEGVKEILEQYPNLPKSVQNAILKNPRGFVSPATTDVQNALLDIQDYLEGTYSEYAPANAPLAPKNVPVAATNQVVSATGENADIQAILEIPPEEWTPEQEKAIQSYKRKR